MEPIKFKGHNKVLGKPSSMTKEECGDLPVFTDEEKCISKWKLSWKERVLVLFKGFVWVWVFTGSTQPPISISTKYPFVERIK